MSLRLLVLQLRLHGPLLLLQWHGQSTCYWCGCAVSAWGWGFCPRKPVTTVPPSRRGPLQPSYERSSDDSSDEPSDDSFDDSSEEFPDESSESDDSADSDEPSQSDETAKSDDLSRLASH
jgi:hypothetical protein